MGYKRTKEELGVNPNPEIWMDIRTKDGWYRKKKPKKKLKLNSVMQAHADALEESMKATKRLVDKLEPWVRGLELGRIRAAIGARLKRIYLETGKMDFTYLNGLDIQPRRTMKDILLPRPNVKVTKEVEVKIMTSDATIKVKKSCWTEYYFELIMVCGDVMKEGGIENEKLKIKNEKIKPFTRKYNGLRVDSVESQLYPKKMEEAGQCVLRIDVPTTKQPWMALLKVGCLEGNELALHPRHYGMKVVAVGGGGGN